MRYRALVSLALTLMTCACADHAPDPLWPCTASQISKVIRTPDFDKLDLLVVVDNSASMTEEQALLRAQFPNLIRTLTTGARYPGDPDPFQPSRDLHVGVVSSDMGLSGVDLPAAGCRADGGDDGRLLHLGAGAECEASYPDFLSYVGHSRLGTLTDPVQFAHDVACVGSLGGSGCGFEQQLEAPFKALWPKVQLDANDEPVMPNDYRFLATTEPGTWGRGDQPAADGGSLGFLRNDAYDGRSLIGILLVTDEDDCSLRSTEQLKSAGPSDGRDIDPSCHEHKDLLHDVTRYYDGFRKLRPGHEELVQFMAIAGVPVDLVEPKVLGKIDFTEDNPDKRNAFYDAILNDPRMQEEPDSTRAGKLKASCTRASPQGTTTAYPPRRIVELAKLFGRNSRLQSICQDDFVPAVTPLIDFISNQLTEVCFPRPLDRRPDGTVSCDVIWELPATQPKGFRAPTQCSQVPFLIPVGPLHAATNAKGGNNCKMVQLPVLETAGGLPPEGQGWYYDDYTADLKLACKVAPRRIAFAYGSEPPRGVTARVVCEDHTQHYPNKRTDLDQSVPQPTIGSSCTDAAGMPNDSACVLTLANNTTLDEMFCHATQGTCVRGCVRDADCPPGWGCDDRPDSIASGQNSAYCINLACGSDSQP